MYTENLLLHIISSEFTAPSCYEQPNISMFPLLSSPHLAKCFTLKPWPLLVLLILLHLFLRIVNSSPQQNNLLAQVAAFQLVRHEVYY